MGERASAYFEQANRLGGVVAKMRLAAISRVTSVEAAAGGDDAETIARLDFALDRLKSDFESAKAVDVAERSSAGAEQDLRTLRRHVEVFLEVMSQRELLAGDIAALARRVNSTAAHTLDCARVSVWLLDARQTAIECIDLYERDAGKHSAGIVLHAKDFPAYFAALAAERTIAAHDAHTDPRTSCFSESYLAPLGISSMLDVPVWVGGATVGVLCHEHIGRARTWTLDEESFAYLMAHFIGIGMSAHRMQRRGQA
jgi:GAF domain-containing protein